ncbi:unnamed protein product [Urochloa decumbens]|uniref:At1g61320/AtMIF1 LRR domain-containing protein n=1 Tax=Urochloa decumbens TaxID=240449 RepID=A0ABC9ABE7_9POAL
MQDAARAACVCRELLQSWRYYPELEFSAKTLSLDEQHTCIQGQMAKDIIKRIDGALQNFAGIWVKRLKFELRFFRKLRAHYINHWLDAAATTLSIKELTLDLPPDGKMKYSFPCELFFDEKGCSIQSLCLSACAFSPEHGSSCFRSLKRVNFSRVDITTEDSWLFLFNSLALEHLELEYCHGIAYLRIPCTLQLLSSLQVRRCNMLQAIESDAPNLATFQYQGPIIQFSLGDALQLKDINISIYPWFNLFNYARKELPALAPNLETLFLMSADEVGCFYPFTIVPHEKSIPLKHLEIAIVGPRTENGYHFEFFSLVTFLNTSPELETFILHVEESAVQKSHLVIDPSKLVKLPKHCHQNIKHVKITGFCPIKELLELTFYILEDAASLRWLTLDCRIHGFEKDLVAHITQDTGTRDYQEWRKNFGDNEEFLKYKRRANPHREAYFSDVAIRKYIWPRVPLSVELKILGAPPPEVISSLIAEEWRWRALTNAL